MFCPNCGLRIINESANFCKRCGKNLGKQRYSSKNPNDIFLQARDKLVQFASPRIKKTRTITANKFDSLQQSIMESKISSDRKTYLAQKLSTLRDKIALREDSAELSIEEAQEIVNISDNLLEQMKDDNCLICYKSLTSSATENTTLVLCPQCGHGGHKNHIYDWFKQHKSCPYCKSTVNADKVLLLNV